MATKEPIHKVGRLYFPHIGFDGGIHRSTNCISEMKARSFPHYGFVLYITFLAVRPASYGLYAAHIGSQSVFGVDVSLSSCHSLCKWYASIVMPYGSERWHPRVRECASIHCAVATITLNPRAQPTAEAGRPGRSALDAWYKRLTIV